MTPAMKALLRKEFVRQRSLLIGGAIMVMLPYAFVAVVLLVEALTDTSEQKIEAIRTWEVLEQAGSIGLVMSCVVAPMFGGGAIAGERPSRSIEFMSPLPLRLDVDLRSRLFGAALMVLLLLAPNLVLVFVIEAAVPTATREDLSAIAFVVLLQLLSVFCAFSVALGASSLLQSPVLATVAGWASVLLILMIGINTGNYGWMSADTFWRFFYPVVATGMGIAGLVIGCRSHLRRAYLA